VVDDERPDLEKRLAAIERLAVGDEEPDEERLRSLRSFLGDEEKVVQRAAAEAFGKLAARGVAVRPLLDEVLRAVSSRVRWGAAFALSRSGGVPAAALPTLLDALDAEDRDLRWAASDLLVRQVPVWGSRAARSLVELVGSGTARQRKMALYCLRDIGRNIGAGGEGSEEVVRRALGDGDVDVRLAAVAALVKVASDRRTAALLISSCLGDRDLRVCRAAAGTLGMLGQRDEEVFAALRGAAQSGDESLRRAADRALERLG
jgi:HEAT repeat protein